MIRRFAAGLVLLGGVLAAAVLAQTEPEEEKTEFTTVRVAANIHLLQVRDQPGFDNIVALTGEEGVLLIDNGYMDTEKPLREALGRLSPRPVRYVINTHFHHAGANAAFAREATIIAHKNVRERMRREVKMYGQIPIGPWEDFALPKITFEREMTLYFNGERIRLVHFPNVHTDGDAIVLFENSNTVATGDFFVPLLGVCDLANGCDWSAYVAGIERLLQIIPKDAKIIPGHGRLSSYRDLQEFSEMLGEVTGSVRKQIGEGRTLEEIKAGGLPERWQSWEKRGIPGDFFLTNVYEGVKSAAAAAPAARKTYSNNNPSWSADGQRILFYSNRDGNYALYSVSVDDPADVKKLTGSEHNYSYPVSSPDGRKIAFSSKRGDDADIFVMDEDGSGEIRLRKPGGDERAPKWSPDGKRFVYESTRDGRREIYLVNADGSGERRLTENEVTDHSPAWFPDGRKIVFSSKRDGTYRIYSINADGSDERQLTDGKDHATGPSVSPDGRKIVYAAGEDPMEIFVMEADGGNPRQLTDLKVVAMAPVWSPDGQKITFMSNAAGPMDIFVIDADGKNLRELTHGGSDPEKKTQIVPPPPPDERINFIQDLAWSPDGRSLYFSAIRVKKDFSDFRAERWSVYRYHLKSKKVKKIVGSAFNIAVSPDGRQIAVGRLAEGNRDIYIYNSDGSGPPRRLTTDEADDFAPAWSPDGDTIAFNNRTDKKPEIYTVRPDGTDLKRLTYSGEHKSYNPNWSPDGKHLVYYFEKGDGRDQLYVIGRDGTGKRQITSDEFNNIFPAWFGRGRIIYGQGKKGLPTRIFTINPDGTGKKQLLGLESFYARVSSDGTKIAYIDEKERAIKIISADGKPLDTVVPEIP